MTESIKRTLSLVALLPFAFAGCDIPKRPPLDPPPKSSVIESTVPGTQEEQVVVEPPQLPFTGAWEVWNAYYIQQNQVGYSHIQAKPSIQNAVVDNTESKVQYDVEDQIRYQQERSTFVQHLQQTSEETARGVLLSFESTVHTGPLITRFSGNVDQEKLVVEAVNGTSVATREIPWQTTNRGLVALQQSLLRKPLQKNETRNLRVLSPINYQMIGLQMRGIGEASIPLLNGEFVVAMEIACRYAIDEKTTFDQILWIDKDGFIIKSLRPYDRLISYKTDRKTALAGATKPEDLVTSTAVAVTGKFDTPDKSTRVAFWLKPTRRTKGKKISIGAFPDQYVRHMDDGSVQVLVSRKPEVLREGFEKHTLVQESSDLALSRFVDFQDGLIQRVSESARAGKEEGLSEKELALKIASVAKGWLDPIPTRGFAKASEIATLQTGQCYENATLLAALLRAGKIPARLAAGFVYIPGEEEDKNPRMAFHIWNLAYVDAEWISLDAKYGGIPPADRITLVTTSLTNGNEYDELKPILEAIGKFTVDIRGASYD